MSESESRFEVTDISAVQTGDGKREWCFAVKGLDEFVKAARFATRREAEKAHRRFKRAIELLTRKPVG